ncbi:MAG: adenylate/guanylate cyclase domain-containing protein [Zoogloeaceae bacterium]|nr:adenylate/guanylate cyclase domain-containing protein [Zoogloeaceae bacterium]
MRQATNLPAFLSRSARAPWFSATLVGMAVILSMMALYVAQPSPIVRLNLKLYDSLLPLRAAPQPSPVPVIIDLDETALKEYGQWPWPRYLVAELLEALNEYQVAAIGLDILFTEADRTSPERLRATLLRDRGVTLNLDGLPQGLRDFDQLLADVLRQGPAVLGFYGRFTGAADDTLDIIPSAMNLVEQASPGARALKDSLPSARSAVLPLPLLRDKTPLGFINVAPDADGVVRKTPLILRVGDAVLPSLTLSALMLATGNQTLIARSGPYGLESLRVGSYNMPVDTQGAMYIPFIGPSGTYPYLSAADVLHRSAPPEALQGRIVFVGTSVPGLLDIRATPLDAVFPGVEIHAAVLDAILAGNAIRVPPWTPAAQILGIFLFGLFAALAFGLARPRVYLPVAGMLMAAPLLLSRHFFSGGVFISPLYVVLTVVLMGVCLVFLRFWQEEKQKLILRNAFSRYVSPEIVKRITKLSGNLFAGEERELSILFTDIRGFTSLSEKLSPQQVVNLLNRYFTPMTALVREHGGTLDKFIGDALMAFWNAPLDVPDHPAQAVTVALAMQEKLSALNEALQTAFGVTLRIGAGIHTGPAYVGNMGSEELINYTLIGDNVNLAARLEGLCPQYGVAVVVSEETRNACGERFVFQYVDTLRVKGKSQPVRIYTPMRQETGIARQDELCAWEEACARYFQGNFAEAADAFSRLHAQFPQQALYAIYTERAQTLRQNPPTNLEHWDFVSTATKK